MKLLQTLSEINWYMAIAYEQAQLAAWNGEVPVGAVIVSESGKILSKTYNLKEINCDPTAHAEILAIREAANKQNGWRLSGCSLYVTLEPCPMCLSAILQARVDQVYFGAYDPKGGSLSLGYAFHRDRRLNHRFKISGGIMHYQCSQLLSNFFRERRAQYKK